MPARRRISVLKKIAARRHGAPREMRPLWLAHLDSDALRAVPSSRISAIAGQSLLTRRELEVLRLVATGETDQGIADTLYLSRRTVNNHVSHILDKLDAPSRRAAVRTAASIGLL